MTDKKVKKNEEYEGLYRFFAPIINNENYGIDKNMIKNLLDKNVIVYIGSGRYQITVC